jgi:hypothetical protein
VAGDRRPRAPGGGDLPWRTLDTRGWEPRTPARSRFARFRHPPGSVIACTIQTVRAVPLVLLLPLMSTACGESVGISPRHGRVAGGEPLRIIDRDLTGHGAPVVFVGARAARGVVLHDDRVMTVIAPEAEAAGVVDVEIHFADGTTRVLPQAFTYEDHGVTLRVEPRRD